MLRGLQLELILHHLDLILLIRDQERLFLNLGQGLLMGLLRFLLEAFELMLQTHVVLSVSHRDVENLVGLLALRLNFTQQLV